MGPRLALGLSALGRLYYAVSLLRRVTSRRSASYFHHRELGLYISCFIVLLFECSAAERIVVSGVNGWDMEVAGPTLSIVRSYCSVAFRLDGHSPCLNTDNIGRKQGR